ncbi:MAG: hypothetical protein WC882_05765 [Candidatus Gracilibacteria bacterium]
MAKELTWEPHKRPQETREKREAKDKKKEAARRGPGEKADEIKREFVFTEMDKKKHAIGILIADATGQNIPLSKVVVPLDKGGNFDFNIITLPHPYDNERAVTGPKDLRAMMKIFRDQGLTCIEVVDPNNKNL